MNAIITGATKGIGRAIAEAFANEQINLAVCARNTDDLKRLEKVMPRGIRFMGKAVDCADERQLLDFAKAVENEFSQVDILVNNVGLYQQASLFDEPKELLQNMLNINLMAAYHLCNYFVPAMRQRQSGHIFNIESVAALQPVSAASSYSISKAALRSFTNILREELRADGVKVTAVIPGSTLTASWEGANIPENRFVQPHDIAQAVLCALKMSDGANVDELLIRPVKGNL